MFEIPIPNQSNLTNRVSQDEATGSNLANNQSKQVKSGPENHSCSHGNHIILKQFLIDSVSPGIDQVAPVEDTAKINVAEGLVKKSNPGSVSSTEVNLNNVLLMVLVDANVTLASCAVWKSSGRGISYLYGFVCNSWNLFKHQNVRELIGDSKKLRVELT